MNGWMWWPTEAEAINRGAPRSNGGGHEPGSEQASPTGQGRLAQARFSLFRPSSGPSGPPNASRSIVDLLPSACGPLTSSSPWFR
jgi:hypothetical protein